MSGSIAYTHVRKQRRTKLDDHSAEFVLISYDSSTKGYRLIIKKIDKRVQDCFHSPLPRTAQRVFLSFGPLEKNLVVVMMMPENYQDLKMMEVMEYVLLTPLCLDFFFKEHPWTVSFFL